MTKAGATIKDDALIIHELGNKENVLYRSQLQEYDFLRKQKKVHRHICARLFKRQWF